MQHRSATAVNACVFSFPFNPYFYYLPSWLLPSKIFSFISSLFSFSSSDFCMFFLIFLSISTPSLTLLLKFNKGKYKVLRLGWNNPMPQSMPGDYEKKNGFSENDLVYIGSMARMTSLALMYHRAGTTSESTSA